MRLLYRNDDGGYSLAEFLYDFPPYAILSHTWSQNSEEVTLDDIVKGTDVRKAGYQKIQFCGEQAVKDDLRYFWVDTCCIDKSSSAELNEAINSMFRWYQNAARCYVYLEDVSADTPHINIDFQHSRWFTRSWTLQELIAPTSVEFLSREGVSVGTKLSKMTEIHETTGIPIEALSGAPMSEFSVEERMSWTKGRKSRREEDESYALFGIFDVYMSIIYGEGKENAQRRLWRKIQKLNNADSYPGWGGESGEDPHLTTIPGQIPTIRVTGPGVPVVPALDLDDESWADEFGQGSHRTTIPGQIPTISVTDFEVPEILELDSDDESEIASIFSDGGMSSSTASTATSPVQTIGIREVSQALLSNDDLRVLYTTAVNSIERRKVRSHFRGFLKNYGRYLLKDAIGNALEIQAAKFVVELAGRIADEISWAITGPEEPRAPRTRLERKDLETWLSTSQGGGNVAVKETDAATLKENVDEIFDEGESDGELDEGLSFPNIDRVKEFLLHSEAFQTHVREMRTWLKMDGSKRKDAERSAGTDDQHLVVEDVTEELLDSPTFSEESQQQMDKNGKRKAEDLTEVDTGHLDIPRSPREPPVDPITTETRQEQTDQEDDPSVETGKELQQESTQQGSTPESQPQTRPRLPPHQHGNSVRDLISALLEFWGLSFFFHDIVDLFLPSVPSGYRRLRWRCSCNTILWGDFPAGDEEAFEQLKREVLGAVHHAPSGGGSSTQQASSGSSASGSAPAQATNPTSPSPGPSSLPSTTGPSSPSNATSAAPSGTDHVVNIAVSVGYFEVCVSKGNHAIDHHEIDISRITSDSELFELIWDKYNVSRGRGLRRVFLRPRDVNFVMFSISRRTHYGAGIHRKPDEFPPQAELDTKRYHYLCPQIRMPGNVFLHYLHRARWNIWGEHSETTWLQRLPKKLNRSLVIEALQNAQHDDKGAPLDADLAFGWGVHILEGPNHAALGWLFAAGVAVSFVVSALLVGFAKTQEQGFGVGSYIVGVVGLGMVAVYSQLQDQ